MFLFSWKISQAILTAVTMVCCDVAAVAAQSSFFDGKTIRLIVGYPAGTTHDIWARMVTPYLKKYLPGNPDFVVQSMAGAGSMVAVNYLNGVAKPDGLTLATFNAALYFEQLIGRKEAQFDWPKLSWIGSSTPATRLFYIRADHPPSRQLPTCAARPIRRSAVLQGAAVAAIFCPNCSRKPSASSWRS